MGRWGEVSLDHYVVQLVLSILSTLGCLFIIFTFKKLKWKSKVHYRLVWWLACALVLYSIEGLIGSFYIYPNIEVCFFALTVSNFGEKASWMVASCISLHLLLLARGFTNKALEKMERLTLTVCWVSAIVLVGGWTIYMVYGPYYRVPIYNECDRYWAKKEQLTMMAFPLFFVFNLGCISAIFYQCMKEYFTDVELRTPLIVSARDTMPNFLLRLSFQPLMFFLGYIITFVSVIKNAAEDNPVTNYDETIFLQINYVSGFLCAAVYGFTPTLTNDYFNMLSRDEQQEMG
jgi:hypothetical protein